MSSEYKPSRSKKFIRPPIKRPQSPSINLLEKNKSFVRPPKKIPNTELYSLNFMPDDFFDFNRTDKKEEALNNKKTNRVSFQFGGKKKTKRKYLKKIKSKKNTR
tara:strand:- start:1048 stop:1359 length:312 start_codon:yes stop_codon:yes gene_type:complete